MSGRTAHVNSLSTMTPTQPSRTTDSASDFASSLREAALLTLKTKRRKAAVAPLPPAALSRPAPPASSLQLDYGNDEPSSPLATSETTISSKSSSASQAPPAQVEPGPTREEGEISDNEDSPVEPKPSHPHPFKGKRPSKQQMVASRGQRAPSQPTSKPGLEKGTTKLTLQARITPQVSVLVSNPTPVSRDYVVDAEHVRPNLALTQVQYDTAKDIILDLLGWGVGPDYLLECGLTRELIYYVFKELNLRLPTNLNTDGIIEFPPPELLAATRQHPAVPGSSQATVQQPPHDGPPASPSFYLPAQSPRLSKPPAPPAPAVPSERPPPVAPTGPRRASISAPAPNQQPEASAVTAPNLHDIEQQRRQELLARKAVQASRKAVQASRKLRQAAVNDGSGPSRAPPPAATAPDQDVEMTSVVATDSVDEFLNSIGSVHNAHVPSEYAKKDEASMRAVSQEKTREAVDADESAASGSSSPSTHPSSTTPAPIESAKEVSPPAEALPKEDQKDPDPVAALPPRARRGVKRPVAADFVDFEQPSGNGYSNSNGGYHFHSNQNQNAQRLKIGTGFASVNGMRRCVIELSDSEDDGVTRPVESDHLMGDDTQRAPSRRPFRTATPVTAGRPAGASAVVVTPGALSEKEQEIRRMKELIKERERLGRLKRLASMTNTNQSTPDRSTMNTPPASIVQEGQQLNGNTNMKDDIATRPDEPPPYTGSSEPPSSSASTSASASATPIESRFDSGAESGSRSKEDVMDSGEEQEQADAIWVEEALGTGIRTVDVVQGSSMTSAQVPPMEQEQEQDTILAPIYQSLFEWYPLLHSDSHSISAAEDDIMMEDLAGPSTVPDLRPLKLASKMKGLDPDKRVCQYEVPGGGVCRDAGCEDYHLSRGAEQEPSDEDTAQYLCRTMRLPRRRVGDLRLALEDARRLHPDRGFEERVAEALVGIISR